MILLTVVGNRYGKRVLAGDPEASVGTGPTEATVFSLLGLLIAFTFSGAFTRLDARRKLVVEEVNAISTAFLRLDLLEPAESKRQMQLLLKDYVDSRLRLWDKMIDRSAALAEVAAAEQLQRRIWNGAISLTADSELSGARRSLLPALTEMFELSNSRLVAVQTHPPPLIYGALASLALVAAFLVGFGMAKSKRLSWVHVLAFAFVMSLMVCLVLDIDYPRFGLIRLDAVHTLFDKLLKTMIQVMEGNA